jgi:hypothetical protein
LIPDIQWPFEAIRGRDGRACDWIVLHGPIVTSAQHTQFSELRRNGARFVGMTSYLDFPRAAPDDGLDYEVVCEAWCHCFREPHRHFRHAAPRALLSASDFTDWAWIGRAAASVASTEAYGVVYVGAAEPWQQHAKNWSLAARCLPRLCRALGMHAMVIGEADAVFPPQTGITFYKALPWRRLLASMARADLLFVPNETDPSPRVIAEALSLDLPVLVNRNILGGWKYVTRYTGAFFDDERDVVDTAVELLASADSPREWFRSNFGPEVSSRRLTALLCPLDDSLDRDAAWRIDAAGPEGHQVA